MEAGICVYNSDRYYYERVVFDYELVFIIDGQFYARENDKVISLSKNQGYIFFPNEIRQQGSFPIKKGTSYFWIHFSKTTKENGDDLNSITINRFADPQNPERLSTLLKWYMQDYVDNSKNNDYHNALFQLILQEFSKTQDQTPKKLLNQTVSNAYTFIMKSFSKNISVPDIASYVGCSPDYLTKIFKEAFGKTVVRFINDIRIEHAKHLLITTNKSIKEIASECGYNSDIHFRETFKKNEGFSPKEFKAMSSRNPINPS